MLQSIHYRDLQRFVIGETRVDGWKSDWRKEQEQRRAEEMANRKFVTAPQIKARQEAWGQRGYQEDLRKPRVHRIAVTGENICEADGCTNYIRRDNQMGRCMDHRYDPARVRKPAKPTVYHPRVPTKFCAGCGKGLRINAMTPKCQKCTRQRNKCACGKTIYSRLTCGMCMPCYKKTELKEAA